MKCIRRKKSGWEELLHRGKTGMTIVAFDIGEGHKRRNVGDVKKLEGQENDISYWSPKMEHSPAATLRLVQ